MWIAGFVLVTGGMLTAWLGRLAMTDRLERNSWAGMRTTTTMKSDDAWYAAHRSAGLWILSGGLIMIATGAVMAGVAGSGDSVVGAVALVGIAFMLVCVSIGGWLGHRAAKQIP